MAEEGKGYGPWVKHPIDWESLRRDVAERREVESEYRQAVERVNLDLLQRLQVPPVLFEGGTNYASAAATYGVSPMKSAADIMQALKDSGAANVVQDSRLRRGAYLVVPPDTYHQMNMGPVFTELPEVEDGPIRFRTFMDYGVRMPIMSSMMISTCGDCGPYEPPYKPRPLPAPVQKVPAWQYVVAVAAGVLILSMMFSAVGAL